MTSITQSLNENDATNDIETYYRPFNVLESISNRQLGISTPSFKYKMRDMKVKQLSRSSNTFEVANCSNMMCKFIGASTYAPDSLIGVWKQNDSENFHSVVHLKIQYSPTSGNDISMPVYIPVQDGPFNMNLDVRDFLYTTANDENILYVIGNTETSGRLQLLSEPLEEWTLDETEMEFPNFVYSVAIHSRNPVIAVGGENTCYLYDSEEFDDEVEAFVLPEMPGIVHALTFNEDGDILYIGCDDGELLSFDLRLDGNDLSYKPFCPCGIEGVIDMKLLSNERQLAFADVDGDMGLLDLRKRRAIFHYPEHKNSLYSRKFTINDELDLMCATGDDNITRLWSLSSGKLLKRIVPPNKEEITHSCLISYHRQWFVVEVQNNVITPILIS
ncbi:uncharacterized protein [Parasteatoda tepidariorum]|uniref:uncharacterized protein n=1 Tax=Parasteatoda tepidariorum TaxID=114398 RepID=UPI00077FBA89|nr:uncharacterized protein LOC107448844 [Parasteatoda tepidariorum]